jgi:hypothetical protein
MRPVEGLAKGTEVSLLRDSQASLLDLDLEGGFESLVGVDLAEEAGLAHEEALTVIVAIAFSPVKVLS